MVAFAVERAALLDALSAAVKVVEKRNTIPILSNVLITAEADGLEIAATDLDIRFTTRVPADVEVPGAFTLPAGPLHDIARKLPAQARITVAQDAGQAKITAARSRFTLPTLPASDFPDFLQPADSRAARLTLAGGVLARLLKRASFAISSEETRYYLNGVYLHGLDTAAGPALRAVATDGHRLARIETTAAAGVSPAMDGVIVPRKTVGELVRIGEALGEAALTLEITVTTLTATAGETVLASKLIDGTFPDYQRVIPESHPHRVVAATAELSAALARVSTLIVERGRAVRVSVADGQMALDVRHPDAGEAREELDVDYEGPALEVGVNSRFFAEILAEVEADATLIEIGDPGSPIRLAAKAGADALFVLMPMRV